MTIKFWTVRVPIELVERNELGEDAPPSAATVEVSMTTSSQCTLTEAAKVFGEKLERALKLVDIGDEE